MPSGFHIATIGDQAHKKTILTADKRTFYTLPGARCIVEGGMQDALRRWVISGALRQRFDLDDNRLMRMRQGLGLGDGRTKAAIVERERVEPDDIPINQIAMVGKDRSAILVICDRATIWQVVPTTSIIYEARLRTTLTAWLKRNEVLDVCKELDVAPTRVVAMRKYFGTARKW